MRRFKKDNKYAQTPEETAQALSETAKKLANMDRAGGFFGEGFDDALTDDYLEQVAGGLPIKPTERDQVSVRGVCIVCGREIDLSIKYSVCPNGESEYVCPHLAPPDRP